MKFLAWSVPPIENKNILPMVWANYDDPDALTQAKNVAAALKDKPYKVVFLWAACRNMMQGVGTDIALAGPPSSEKITAWYETFWTTLKSLGITPDIIVCDFEDWIYDWNWGRPIDEVIKAGNNIKTAYLRATYYPATFVYGKKIPYVGWCSFLATNGANVDRNGWTYPQGGDYSYTGHSSPAIYLDQGGNMFNMWSDQGRGPALTHDVMWNCFLQNLNNLRACQDSWTSPWVSYTSFSNDGNTWRNIPKTNAWLWNEQLKHVNAMGIDTILYWNPAECITANDTALKMNTTFQNECINALPPTPKKPGNLPQIAYDSDVVTTSNVTTKYADFVAMLSKDGCKVYDKTNQVAAVQPVIEAAASFKVTGKVTTADGKPDAGAVVGLKTKTDTAWAVVDSNGNYEFNSIKNGYYSIVMLKARNKGLKADQYYQIEVKNKDIQQDVVIK